MNVSCPTCTTVFRIDPAKVPLGGIRARCSECGGAIDVPDSDWNEGVTLTPQHVAAFDQGAGWAVDPFATPLMNPAVPAVPTPAAPTPRSSGAVRGSGAVRRASIEAMIDSDSAAAPEPEFEDEGPFGEPLAAEPPPIAPTPAVAQPLVPTPVAPAVVVPTPVAAQPAVPTPVAPRAAMPPIARPGAARPAVPTPRFGTPVAPVPRVAAPAIPTRPLGTPVVPPVAPPAAAAAAPSVGVPRTPAAPTQPSIPAVPAASGKPTPGSGRVVNPFLTNDPSTKAKRLARALVSDMIAYLPAKREEGLRNGTLKQLFREEIKKSYEEYVDQVGATMAETTTYFQDALNEILAGGKTIF